MKGFFSASDAEIIRTVAEGIKSGRFKVFVKGTTGFCILHLPQTALESPQVLHFYSEKPGDRSALVQAVLDFLKRKGYNKLIGINRSGFPDDVWTRAFRNSGWEIKPVKTVFEFEVKQ